jgi:hypothetical protein
MAGEGDPARSRAAPRLLPLAAMLGDGQDVFESAIRGSSMAPAVPPRARLRVRLQSGQPCAPGDVVFYQADDGYMVHRVVYVAGRSGDGRYLLTCGDNRLAPDPPVRPDQVLGTVIAVQGASGWRPPGPPRIPRRGKRVVRAITVRAMIVVLGLSLSAAGRLARALLPLEMASRAALARLRRA